jgi:putative acetyltransferase
MRTGEERQFLEIHSRSVRGLASGFYPQAVIDGWAGGTSDAQVQKFSENPDREIRLIAELDGEPVGLGALVVANNELRACYVVPEAARRGVGTALVQNIERIAREHGVSRLELHSSVNAEPFYLSVGYRVAERMQHRLRSGLVMDAVRMEKHLV